MDGRLSKGVFEPAGEISQSLAVSSLQIPGSTEMLEVGHLVSVGSYKVRFQLL